MIKTCIFPTVACNMQNHDSTTEKEAMEKAKLPLAKNLEDHVFEKKMTNCSTKYRLFFSGSLSSNAIHINKKINGARGGRMVLGKAGAGVLLIYLNLSRARAYCACRRCGWGLFGHFCSRLSFLFSPLSGRWSSNNQPTKVCTLYFYYFNIKFERLPFGLTPYQLLAASKTTA